MTEFMLVVAIPVVWAIWELIALERHRRRVRRQRPGDEAPGEPGNDR